jgi:hypothetical protein
VPRLAAANRAISCHILSPLRAYPWPAIPNRAVFRRVTPNTVWPGLAMPYRGLSPLRAYPCRVKPYPTKTDRGLPCRIAPCPAIQNPAQPIALTGVSLPSLTWPVRVLPRQTPVYPAKPHRAIPCRPCGRIPARPRHAAPGSAWSCPAVPGLALPSQLPLWGVSLPSFVLPSLARPRQAVFRRASPRHTLPCLIALVGRIPALTSLASSRRAVPRLARTNLAVPCRDYLCKTQSPEHLCSRDLLKVHGGCTDVRDVEHERATKQPPSREPSAVPVYHSRVVPVNRG